jgi:hypothetical protein
MCATRCLKLVREHEKKMGIDATAKIGSMQKGMGGPHRVVVAVSLWFGALLSNMFSLQ